MAVAISEMTEVMQVCAELSTAVQGLEEEGLALHPPEDFKKIIKKEISSCGEELDIYAYISMLTHAVIEEMGLDPSSPPASQMQALYGTSLKREFKIVKREEIKKIPFFAIPFKRKTYGKYSLEMEKIHEGQLCHTGPYKMDKFLSYDSLGYMDQDTRFPCIIKGDTIWFGSSPDIINITEPIVEQVSGHVLSLGLGIGYFEFMASLKDEVEKITVVEKDTDLIEIFKENVLPYIKKPERIDIVQADPYAYMNRLKEFPDCCVVDIEMEPDSNVDCYLIMKDHEKRMPETKFLYFNEETILSDLIMYVVKEVMTGTLGYVVDMGTPKEERITSKIGRIYADTLIFRPSDLEKVVNIENIRKKISE